MIISKISNKELPERTINAVDFMEDFRNNGDNAQSVILGFGEVEHKTLTNNVFAIVGYRRSDTVMDFFFVDKFLEAGLFGIIKNRVMKGIRVEFDSEKELSLVSPWIRRNWNFDISESIQSYVGGERNYDVLSKLGVPLGFKEFVKNKILVSMDTLRESFLKRK